MERNPKDRMAYLDFEDISNDKKQFRAKTKSGRVLGEVIYRANKFLFAPIAGAEMGANDLAAVEEFIRYTARKKELKFHQPIENGKPEKRAVATAATRAV